MHKSINHHPVIALFVAVVFAVNTIIPVSSLGQAGPAGPDFQAEYEEAEFQYEIHQEAEAAQILEQMLETAGFPETGLTFKTKVHLLLAKSYYRMSQIEKAKIEAVKDVFRKILALNSKIDFATLLDDEQLLEIARKVQGPLPPRGQLLFDYRLDFDPRVPIEVAAGKTATLAIGTAPDSVAVLFSLPTSVNGLRLEQTDSVSALLTYAPDKSEAGTATNAIVQAASVNTTKSLHLVFDVKEPGSNKLKYILITALAVTAGTVIALVAGGGGGGGGGGDETNLDDPPDPPAKK